MTKAVDIIKPDRAIDDIIADLKITSREKKTWTDIEKEYEPKLHPVMTDATYKDTVLPEGQGIEKVTRITIGLQKLAAKRMAQLMFGIPVKRIYKAKTDQEKEAAKIIEKIYSKNRIDAINIERGKFLFAGCETATLWYAVEEKNDLYGVTSEIKVRCRSYSPMNGDMIFPRFNEYDDLIALSFEYTRKEDSKTVRYFDTYTNEMHIKWKCGENNKWEEIENENHTIGKIPAVYICRSEPIWEDTSNDVYEVEWTLSRNGNYIRKNSKPLFIIYADDDVNTGGEKNNDSRSVFQYPANAKANYVTWEQATASIELQIANLYRAFFTQIQIPDMSFDQMKSTPMSGEARKMMFVDAQLKVKEESGIWIEALDREMNVIKEFAKTIAPKLKTAIDALEVETLITAFNIADETETIKNIMTATGGKAVVSQKEGIEYLGWSDDADATLKQITDESKSDLFNPTN